MSSPNRSFPERLRRHGLGSDIHGDRRFVIQDIGPRQALARSHVTRREVLSLPDHPVAGLRRQKGALQDVIRNLRRSPRIPMTIVLQHGFGRMQRIERGIDVQPCVRRQIQLVATQGRWQHLRLVEAGSGEQRAQLADDGVQRRVPGFRQRLTPQQFRQLVATDRCASGHQQPGEHQRPLAPRKRILIEQGTVAFHCNPAGQVDSESHRCAR